MATGKRISTMYTDETILTFGKHKFTKLCRVPAEYLLKLHENRSYANAEIKEYIEQNLEKLIQKRFGIISPPPFEFPCRKITYANEKDAKYVLKQISQVQQQHKKPVRHYQCDDCGGWHLTSKELKIPQSFSITTSPSTHSSSSTIQRHQ